MNRLEKLRRYAELSADMQKMPMTHPSRMLQKISKEKEAIVLGHCQQRQSATLAEEGSPDSLIPPVLTSFYDLPTHPHYFWISAHNTGVLHEAAGTDIV